MVWFSIYVVFRFKPDSLHKCKEVNASYLKYGGIITNNLSDFFCLPARYGSLIYNSRVRVDTCFNAKK